MTALEPSQVSRFLTSLARQLPCPVKLILTGGVEALILGGTRPTGDIDFGVVVPERHRKRWPEIEAAIAAAAATARVSVQYSEDIDRWSSIAIPRPRFKTRRYRKIGRLAADLLEPRCWAVYKLARYLESDIEDLIAVLSEESIPPGSLARLCGESLRASPRSPSLFLFRKQVEHFFRTHGATIWREAFDHHATVAAFHRAAGIAGEREGPLPRKTRPRP